MNIALVGGTHGNEPVGLEVMRLFKDSKKQYRNSFTCFWGNPKAFELKKRYVDTDLNRAFGKNQIRVGHEKKRAEELESQIKGNFDLCIDLHTTTSNMGLTAILNNTHKLTRKIGTALNQSIEGLKLIEEDRLDDECNHLNRLCPAGVTIEVGPIANNVVSADLVMQTTTIVEEILEFDFDSTVETQTVEYFKMLKQINYPSGDHWYIHPSLDRKDFGELKTGQPIFLNFDGRTEKWSEDKSVYPFFINEAAYLEHRSAFLVAEKRVGF